MRRLPGLAALLALVIGTASTPVTRAADGPPGDADDWKSLGGNASADVAACSGGGRTWVFIRGQDNALWYKQAFDGAWTPEWKSIGGNANSAPGVACAGNDVHVFFRGTDGSLFYRWTMGNGEFSPYWTSLGKGPNGHPLFSAPAPVRTPQGWIHVFVKGSDTAVWKKLYSNGEWSDWEKVGGEITGDPAAFSFPNGDPFNWHVVARGTDNQLHWLPYRDHGVRDWVTLPGRVSFEGPDFCGGSENAGPVVYAKGTDGTLQLKSLTTFREGPWVSITSAIKYGPGCAYDANRGFTHVFVVTPDGAVWYEERNSG